MEIRMCLSDTSVMKSMGKQKLLANWVNIAMFFPFVVLDLNFFLWYYLWLQFEVINY